MKFIPILAVTMANLVLDITYEYDFLLFGIVSSVRDYKLAWLLNKELKTKFHKEEEIDLFSDKTDKECWLSYYLFYTDMYDFTLIKNKSVEFLQVSKPYLLPELKEYDYFLKFGGESDIYTEDFIKRSLSLMPHITYLRLIDVDELKQKENLLII